MGIGVPVKTVDDISLGFAINLQYQYAEITNISDLSQYYFIKEVSREQRDLDLECRRDERLVFYRAVTNLLETYGMNGQDCIKRAICEAAQYPVEEEGLVGEIIQILLTPDYGRSPFEKDPDWEKSMGFFHDAAVAGRQMFNCPSVYSGCPEGQGFFELISMLKDE
ncbi:uncharacterized protein LOC126370754 [Pectinophora gossypiella]|uniref:uncharacterized protein LOC126370754 n=1 Tax=Pectinophora gossypiella TaxID=13191 RepID=UPI00214E041D|nr:uncharacterized protein LOC126370754 [Pectinophora gossypiella]